ncbi:MAG TPA: YbaY family lipoprotein [Burkholderiaceae bacterium]|nr:YbaY family lipoprotein [Burkholderiaceae bacterium]
MPIIAATIAVSAVLFTTPARAEDVIRGTASYRERLMLPPQAVFEARLEDVSRADAPARVLGQSQVTGANSPIRFEIPYLREMISARSRYTVSARITVDGEPWFVNDTRTPVFADAPGVPPGGVREVQLALVRVSPRTSAPPSAPEMLLNVRWVLVKLGDVELASRQGTRQPTMMLTSPPGRLEAFGGCNRLFGAYTAEGAKLTFGPGIGMTRMACAGKGVAELESGFAQALQATARWRIDGNALELLDETGGVLARFVR